MNDQDWNTFLQDLEKVTGQPLKSERLIRLAFVHRSFANESGDATVKDNERLEFLGDAVLDLIVSDRLMKKFPKETEGNLSKYRSAIVNERSLAEVARNMNLGKYLQLGKGEELTNGRNKDSILANTFEAVIAALYLDGDLRSAEIFVDHHLSDSIRNVRKYSVKQDFKTALQEFTQKNLKTTPIYLTVKEEGPDHAKMFETEVKIQDKVYGRGIANSKKQSEQICAQQALEQLSSELDQDS